MTKKPIIVFDLDGTLVATAADLVDALNYCLKKHGNNAISSEDLSKYIGRGGQTMISKALEAQGQPADAATVEAMLKDFSDFYGRHIPGKTHYFNGLTEIFKTFLEQGYLLAVCTNKLEHLAKKLINALDEQLGIENPFAAICGGDSFPWKKPDPRHIFSTIERAGGDPHHALMVGDSAPDIEAAHAAHLPSIAVSFGYSDIPVHQLHPTKIINSYSEFTPELIKELMNKHH